MELACDRCWAMMRVVIIVDQRLIAWRSQPAPVVPTPDYANRRPHDHAENPRGRLSLESVVTSELIDPCRCHGNTVFRRLSYSHHRGRAGPATPPAAIRRASRRFLYDRRQGTACVMQHHSLGSIGSVRQEIRRVPSQVGEWICACLLAFANSASNVSNTSCTRAQLLQLSRRAQTDSICLPGSTP